ncbi:hypothetical protein MMC11_001848 [Xylographa trunciseda]|nr:hypothetical protein [Xylographa trunciseda]
MDSNSSPAAINSDLATGTMAISSPELVDTAPRASRLYDPSSSPPRNGIRENYRHRLFPTPSPPDSPVLVAAAGGVSLSPTTSEISETATDGEKACALMTGLRKLVCRGSRQRTTKHDEDFAEISDLDLRYCIDVGSKDSSKAAFFVAPERINAGDAGEPMPEFFDIDDEEDPNSTESLLNREQQGVLASALRGTRISESIRVSCGRMHDRLYGDYQNLDFGTHPQQGVFSIRLGRWRRWR